MPSSNNLKQIGNNSKYKYEALAQIAVIFSNERDFKYKGRGDKFFLLTSALPLSQEKKTQRIYIVF